MVIYIDIVLFGKVLFSNVGLLERNVSLVACYFGLVLKWTISNIQNKEEGMPVLDIFFGSGFTDIFKGDMDYLLNPFKQLLKLEGPLFSLIVVSLAGIAIPFIVNPISNLATFRAFLFKALVTGYSADLLTAQIRSILEESRKSKMTLDAIEV